MIVLMNYAVPLIILIGMLLAYKLKKLYPAYIGVALAIVYVIAQPTMLPKGTVSAPVIAATEFVDKPIVDRSLKPMTDADRDQKRNVELKQINDSIEKAINKETK